MKDIKEFLVRALIAIGVILFLVTTLIILPIQDLKKGNALPIVIIVAILLLGGASLLAQSINKKKGEE